MRTIRTLALLACATTLPGACASDDGLDDVQVETRTNPSFTLRDFRTYAWLTETASVRDPDGEWAPAVENTGATLRSLVDRQLRKHGRRAVEHTPDMYARLEFGVDMKATAMKVDGDRGTARFESRPRGGIQIVLTDRVTRRDVWAGRALGDVTPGISPERSERRLRYAVEKMFADFPD